MKTSNFYRQILDQVPIGICVVQGQDFVVQMVNKKNLTLWQKDLTDVLNTPFFDVFPTKLAEFKAILQEVYNTGVPHTIKSIVEHWADVDNSAATAWYDMACTPMHNASGEVTALMLTYAEVTPHVLGRKKLEEKLEEKLTISQLKRREETFQLLSNTLPQLVWMTDEKGQRAFRSIQWAVYTGIGDMDDDDFWHKVIHPDDKEALMENWTEALAHGTRYNCTVRVKHHDGDYRWNRCEGVAIRNNCGEIIYWVGAYSDIHEEKMNEQKKDEFISIASHEMKTPLTTAKAYLQLLEMTLDQNDTPSVYAKKASASVERLHILITELLESRKIQSGKLSYTISSFNFDEMLNVTIEDIQYTTTQKIVKTGKIKRKFRGDKDRLQQVFINLLTNAIKYSPNAQEVLVNVEEQPHQLKVSVTDKGVGMAKKHLDKIFDRYYRVEEHAIQFQGLGIGLYISHEIIQRHLGKMWVESVPQKGSTFHFTLPFINNLEAAEMVTH